MQYFYDRINSKFLFHFATYPQDNQNVSKSLYVGIKFVTSLNAR